MNYQDDMHNMHNTHIPMALQLLGTHSQQAQWFAKRPDGWTTGGRISSLTQLEAVERNARELGWNLYLNLNPTRPCGKYAKRPDVTHWRYACLDLDPPGDGLTIATEPTVPEPWDRAVAVFTGRGYQYWLPICGMPSPPPEWAERAMRALLKATSIVDWKVDMTCSDLPRRVRCPGSINLRTGECARVLRPATGCWNPVEPPPEILPQPVTPLEVTPGMQLTDILPHLKERNLKAYRFALYGWEHPGRHDAAYTLIKTLHEMGVDANRALRWARTGNEGCKPQPISDRDIVRNVRQVYGN